MASFGTLFNISTFVIVRLQEMRFNEEIGSLPKFLIKQLEKHGELPEVSDRLIPIEVRTRDKGVPEFDSDLYFR